MEIVTQQGSLSTQLVLEVSVPNMHDVPVRRYYYVGVFPDGSLAMAMLSEERTEFGDTDTDSYLLISSLDEFFKSFEKGHGYFLQLPDRSNGLPTFLYYDAEFMSPWMATELELHLYREVGELLPESLTSLERVRLGKWRNWIRNSK